MADVALPVILSDDDIAALLAPLPGDPAGKPIEECEEKGGSLGGTDGYLEKLRFGGEFAGGDVAADPVAIVRVCTEKLRKESKSLQIAVRLVEGLTRLHGLYGLRDGLRFLNAMCEQAWDRMHPLGSDDPEDAMDRFFRRAGDFGWLLDQGGVQFGNTLRKVPMVYILPAGMKLVARVQDRRTETTLASIDVANTANLDDLQPPNASGLGAASKEKIAENAAKFKKIRDAMGYAEFQRVHTAISESHALLTKLTGTVAAKMGYPPGLGGIKPVLDLQYGLAGKIIDELKPAEDEGGGDGGGTGGDGGEGQTSTGTSNGGGGGGVSLGPVNTGNRKAIYAQIGQLAAALAQIEPHSPVPFLLKRAVALGEMPFDKLIDAIWPEGQNMATLRREFALPDPNVAPPPSE